MNTLKRLLNWIFSDYSSRPRAAQRKMPAEKAREVAQHLASGAWTHDFPSTAETAKDLIGLPAISRIVRAIFLY